MAVQGPLPPPRRRRLRRLSQALRHGALTLALLAGPLAGQAAAQPRVLLHLPTGTRAFDEQELGDSDVLSEDYVLRSPSSEEHETLSGISIQRLLEKAGYAPREGFLRLSRADGTWATLTAGDAGEPSPFQDGRKPIVFLDSERMRYVRPVRDASDVNGRDNVATGLGQPLEIWAQTGAPLSVTATASPADVAKGGRVTFSARVSGARDGEAVSVRWRFDDSGTARGMTVRHAYGAEGVYGVVAIAEGDQGSGGASEVVRVEVGAPPKRRGPGTGGTRKKGPAPQTGPSRGPSTGGGSHQRDRRPGRVGGSTGGGAPQPAATDTPAPAATPRPTATPGRRTKRRRRDRAPAGGELVRGVLVSSSAPLPAPATAIPARAGARAAARAGASAPAVSGGTIAILLLFAAGAWRERPPPRRKEA